MKDDRVTSSFGLSIATGIMLESAFEPTHDRYDKDRKAPDKVKMDTYSKHYYNIYTLIRNINGSLPKSIVLSDKELIDTLVEEIYILETLYSNNTKCKPVLYYFDYSKVVKKLNKNKPNMLNKVYLTTSGLYKVLKKLPKDLPLEVVTGTHLLPMDRENKILITTHIATDLLNIKRIPNLELLESHTGRLKNKYEFNSKLHSIGKRDLSILPFTEELVYLYGDKGIVVPTKMTLRRILYTIAVDNKWNPRIPEYRVKKGLRIDKDSSFLLEYYNKQY